MPVRTTHAARPRLRALPLLAAVVFLAFAPAAATPALAALTVTPVGSPTWEPVDFHLFSAPIGDPPNFPDNQPNALGLLPNHVAHPQLFVGPGPAHAPPYNGEFAAGVAAQGYADKDVFAAAEFTGPNAVWLVFMVVPKAGAPTGSSPDFASGPIIPNTLFPLDVTLVNNKSGTPFSGTGAFQVPPLNDPGLTPSFNVDGHSHFPSFVTDNLSFATDPSDTADGSYEYVLNMRDQTGAGYDIAKTFTVSAVPLPAGVWAATTCLGGLGVASAVRRRRAAR